MTERHTSGGAGIPLKRMAAIALLLPLLPIAPGVVAEESGTGNSFHDSDGDGWDDLWMNLFGPTIDATKPNADSNGDGVSDYESMLRWLDPHADNTTPLSDKSLEAQSARETRWARNREHAAPWTNRGIRNQGDQPVTLAQSRDERRQRILAQLPTMTAEANAARERVAVYMEAHGDKLPEKLRQHPPVDVREGRPVFYGAQAWNTAIALGVDDLWPGGALGVDLTGAGTTVAMWDEGEVLATHEQFGGRVTNAESSLLSDHATSVAAVIAGGGDSSLTEPDDSANTNLEEGRGMAYGAEIVAYDRIDDVLELVSLEDETMNIQFSNHSYGDECGWEKMGGVWYWFGDPALSATEDWKFGFYRDGICDVLDLIVYSKQTLLPVFPTGNDGNFGYPDTYGPGLQPVDHYVIAGGAPVFVPSSSGIERDQDGTSAGYFNAYETLRPQACAKNVLTVGTGVSGGPTDDGRLKPEVVLDFSTPFSASAMGTAAYGTYQGSSYFAGAMTGMLNLAATRHEFHAGGDRRLLASTWKALAIAATGGGDTRYLSGFGESNASHLIEIIDANAASPSQHTFIKEIQITNDGPVSFPLFRDPLQGGVMTITICWTDPPGTPPTDALDPTALMLVNDLDLRVIAPDGTTVFYPFSPDPSDLEANPTPVGDNFRDNYERVCINVYPMPTGFYTVEIGQFGPFGTANDLVDDTGAPAPQDVSIVFTNVSPLNLPFRIASFVQTGSDEFALAFYSAVGGLYRIERSTDLETWSPEPGEILASAILTSVPITAATGPSAEFFRVVQLD